MLKTTKSFVANCIKIINIILRIDVPPNDIEKLARPRVNSSMSEWSVSLKEASNTSQLAWQMMSTGKHKQILNFHLSSTPLVFIQNEFKKTVKPNYFLKNFLH